MAQSFTTENFDKEVINANGVVLVDFWASWCGPCRMVAPIIDQLEEEYAGKIKVGKVNIDEQYDLAMKYHIASIPTLMLFDGGEAMGTLVGYRPKESIEEFIG